MNRIEPTPGKANHRSTEGMTLREALDDAARRRPDAPFVISPETQQTLTFSGARERAYTMAAQLTHLGLAHGATVVTLLDNGVAAAELILGCLYGGYVPVPVNVAAGPAHVASVVRHSDASIAFVGAAYQELLEAALAQIDRMITVIVVDAQCGPEWTALAPVTTTLPPIDPADNGLLIYSSGSTGRPKGALFSQRQVMLCGMTAMRCHQLTSRDRLLCVLPLYHLNSVCNLLGLLLSGSSMVMPQRFNVATFWELVTTHRCTWLAVVPAIVAQLLYTARRDNTDRRSDLSHVRFARSSSAPLSPAQHRAFEESFGILLIEGMGMTEAGFVFLNPLTREERKIGSIGIPHGFEVQIVDPHGQALGANQVGAIVLRGPSVMTGYYKDPQLTEAVLDEHGWLRSGDEGYRDDDGYYFHVGRTKDLIIKGGTNIAPREIDEVLESHPDVSEAAAVGVPDRSLGEDVVAYVVLKPGSTLTSQALHDLCESRLGAFKAPSQIHFIGALPKGPSGKVQRLKLTQLSGDASTWETPLAESTDHQSASPRHDGRFVAPQTPAQRVLAELWCEVLGLERVGIHSDFFACGGFSLLAVQILSGARRRFSIEIPLSVFFECPTIAEQAAVIEQQLARRAAAPLSLTAPVGLLAPVRTGCSTPPLFCAYAPTQYRQLALHLGPEQPTYATFAELEIDILAGQQTRLPTVEELAGLYIQQLKEVQPIGPYLLAGWSFGGRIAFEMAQQLRGRGDEVALLAIFDTYMPGATRWRPLAWLAHHTAQSLRKGPRYVMRALQLRLERSGVHLPRAIHSVQDPTTVARQRDVELRRLARKRYVPRPYPGKIVLFRAHDPIQFGPGYHLDPMLGWERLACGGLEVHEIPGNHGTMLTEPHVRVLAEKLKAYLDAPR